MDVPLVSVIVPSYNHARFLPKRVESILRQTFQDFELILLDDCSPDGSREILLSYASDPRVRIEFNEKNSGSTFKQWNKGVRMARGKYVWIAESDDYADERLLERLVGVLEGDESIVCAYCRSWRVSVDDRACGYGDYYLQDVDAEHWATDFCVDGREECRKYFGFSNPVPNASAVVFRRSEFEAVGGADESFRMCGDWKLWAALAMRGKIAYMAEPLNYWRYHEASVRETMPQVQNVAETLRVVKWVLKEVGRPEKMEELCERHAAGWIPVLLSMAVPARTKGAIARDLMLIDRHAVRRIFLPGVTAVRLKLRRHLAGAAVK